MNFAETCFVSAAVADMWNRAPANVACDIEARQKPKWRICGMCMYLDYYSSISSPLVANSIKEPHTYDVHIGTSGGRMGVTSKGNGVGEVA